MTPPAMNRQLMTPAIADAEIPILNLYYLHACRTPSDPTIVWGTDVETDRLTEYVSGANRGSHVLISPAHVLIKAVGRALVLHPEFNRRILGRRLYRFRDVNVLMPFQRPGGNGAGLCLFNNVDTSSLSSIATHLWKRTRETPRDGSPHGQAERTFRLLPRWLAGPLFRLQVWIANRWNRPVDDLNEPLRASPVLVNYLGFNGAPPMRSFNPSRFPTESFTLSVTMGPAELRPLVQDGRVVARRVAPLFVRADHRLVDAYDLGKFVSTLRNLLNDPTQLDGTTRGLPTVPRRAALSSVSNIENERPQRQSVFHAETATR